MTKRKSQPIKYQSVDFSNRAGEGHCAVISTDDGDYIYCHAYDKDFDFASKLLVRIVEWSEDGWPVVNL